MKFKVGDEVKVTNTTHGWKKEYVGKTFTIKYINPNGEHCFNEPHYGVGAPYVFTESELIPAINPKIVITTDGKITTAKLYENGKVVKTAEAKCCPEDTFDFNVGANLAVRRLTNVEEAPKYYNGKVVCVNVGQNTALYTKGKIYQFVDGVITSDGGVRLRTDDPIETFDEFDKWTYSKFIEVVE